MKKQEAFSKILGGEKVWHPASGMKFVLYNNSAYTSSLQVMFQWQLDMLPFEEGYEIFAS